MSFLMLAIHILGQESKGDPVEKLIRAADVGSDKTLERFLADQNHRAKLPAPAKLRELLSSLKIVRTDLGLGYNHEKGRASIYWWINELGTKGDADAVAPVFADFFQTAGFSAKEDEERGTKKTTHSLAKNGVAHEVILWGPVNWVGGRETACGTRVLWRISDESESPRPTLGKLLERFDHLRDARLEEEHDREGCAFEVESLAVGGTWTKYYDWDVTFFGAGREGRSKLEKLLVKLGYERTDKDKEFDGYHRKKSGSYAWLYPCDKEGRVRLRFQPES